MSIGRVDTDDLFVIRELTASEYKMLVYYEQQVNSAQKTLGEFIEELALKHNSNFSRDDLSHTEIRVEGRYLISQDRPSWR